MNKYNDANKTAHYIRSRNAIKIDFPPDLSLIKDLSKLPISEIDGEWEVLATEEAIILLEKLGFVFSKSLEKQYRECVKSVPRNCLGMDSDIPIFHDYENLKLYPFQEDGVQYLIRRDGNGLIADDPGLGKTVQALSYIKQRNYLFPILIVCPATLKINWKRETMRWVNIDAQILTGTLPKERIKRDIVIINYDILPYWLNYLKDVGFNLLIADEAQYIKNNQARRTKAFKALMKRIPRLLALTGTPIENRPVEIYNILQMIDPELFPNFIFFAKEFCGAKKSRFGWDFTGATNLKKLNLILKSTGTMLRRKKEDVLLQLPPKQIAKVPIEIENRIEYDKAEQQFISYLKEKFNQKLDEELKIELKNFAKRNKIEVSDELTDSEAEELIQEKYRRVASAPILSQIEVLKQLVIKGKLNKIINWIEDFIESGEKLVIFCVHRKIVDQLLNHFAKVAVKIGGTGSRTLKQRQIAIDRFQNDPKIKLFIGNIQAAGLGITLTAASNVAIIQFPWSPKQLLQATDRVHRITQKKQVTIWHLIGADTIEERILDLLKNKEQIIDAAIDGIECKDESIIVELINSYRPKR